MRSGTLVIADIAGSHGRGDGGDGLGRVGLLVSGALLRDQLAGRVAHFRVVDQADRLHVLLHHAADLGHDAGHVDAAGLEIATARVEDGLELFNDKRHVATLAEDGGQDSGQRHDPLEVVHVLRVDE